MEPTCVERPESVNTAPKHAMLVKEYMASRQNFQSKKSRTGATLNTNKSLDVDFQESGFTSR